MHRTLLRARIARVLPLTAALAACDGAEGSAGIARPEQMQLAIVQGRGMHLPVRDPATPESDPGLAPQAVVARVSLRRETEVELGEKGATGPDRPRLPPVEIHWRMVEPWCSAQQTVTPVNGDTASNHFVRPTRTVVCHLVAEGVVDGRVFDADTAVAQFEPGPAVTFQPAGVLLMGLESDFALSLLARGPLDHYGNNAFWPPAYTAQLTAGPPVVTRADTMIYTHGAEGYGNVRMTVGARTADIAVWVTRGLTSHWWHINWACYDAELPGGAHADSARFQVDAGQTFWGAFSERGLTHGLTGTLTQRVWVRGEGVRETVVPTSRYLALRPHELSWHNNERAVVTRGVADQYDGGNLCEPLAGGGAWARHTPARMVRGDSILPDF